MRYWMSSLFILLLIVPAMLGFMGKGATPHHNAKAPGLVPANFWEAQYYQAWGDYLKRRLADMPQACWAKNWLDYRLFAMTDHADIHVGRNGWLFTQQAIADFRKQACGRKAQACQLHLDVKVLARLFDAAGKRFAFGVLPNKSTLYPEFVGKVPVASECGQSFLDLLLAEQARTPVKPFVRLDRALKRAKTKGTAVFSKTITDLTPEGAKIAANAILDRLLDEMGRDAAPSNDLAYALFGQKPIDRVDTKLQAEPRPSGSLATALVYGGSGVGRLLPTLASHFDRVDVIVSDTLPSLSHEENPADYEAVIVAVPEARLDRLHLDLNRLCTLLKAEILADHRASLPLNTLSSYSHLSLEIKDQQVAVKSLGSTSFFNVPALPGSDEKTLRLLKLPISSDRTDTLSWLGSGLSQSQGAGLLRPGANKIYIPLPEGRPVKVRVNPGKHTGLFHLSNIELLEYELIPPSGSAQGGHIPLPAAPQPGHGADQTRQEQPPIDSAIGQGRREEVVKMSPAIHLNDFEDGCVIQRHGDAAEIVISGTFQGHPAAIEARILHHGDHQPVTAWTEIDSAPNEGVFMGILTEVPQGGWYRVTVRFKDMPEVVDKGRARWGVGILAACIGQSNMKEWFHSGTSLKAHSLLSLHREGRWQPQALHGNGAVAFGNRLIGRLAIPVGLLDYAVNGSGLRKEADWGAGYWTDRSPKGVYRDFIRNLSAAGGALEYVVFMQGEADAARATISESQYLDALIDLVTQQLRNDVVNGSQRPRLPFLIVGMPKRPVGGDFPHQAIRNAHMALTREVPECYLAANSLDLANQGKQHLTPEAYTALGLRTAQTVLYLLNDARYYQGPRVSGAYMAGPGQIDVTLLHRGGWDFSPRSRISGWEVIGNQKPVQIDNVVRLNAQTIRIALAAPTAGPLTLRYLYGAMPNAKRPVRDNTPMELPLEPFEGVVK